MGILANNEGKILRSNQTGDILKQNYNFGNGFYKGETTNCYIDFPNLMFNIQNDFSLITWFKSVQSDDAFSFQWLIRDDLDNCFLSSYRVNTNKSLISGDSWNSAFNNSYGSNTINDTISTGKTLTAAIKSGSSLTQRSDLKTNFNPSFNFQNTNYTDLYLNVGNATGGLKYNISIIPYFLLYSRAISDSEYIYLFNNKLSNPPLSLFASDIYLKNDIAELFDFGGTIGQAVGVRDFSGNNNHGRILNLPAGTLQEQLDYANANLFELW